MIHRLVTNSTDTHKHLSLWRQVYMVFGCVRHSGSERRGSGRERRRVIERGMGREGGDLTQTRPS